MSNFLAIATVTAVLSETLQAAAGADVPGATVTTVRPTAPGSGVPAVGVNIFLYQVTPNAAWRNSDLPTRRAGGDLVRRPRVALDLHYLLSCYGDDGLLEPQRLVGSITRTLHAQPVLSRQQVRNTIANPTFSPFLAGSNLADDVELVKFVPAAMTLEELSKLWSVFFQTPYALSVAYQATVVLIEPDLEPGPMLPVRRPVVQAVAFRNPVLHEIQPPMATLTPGAQITLRGSNLRGERTIVRLAKHEITPEPGFGDDRLVVTLQGPIEAGIAPVQVIHLLASGKTAAESNVLALVIKPILSSVAFSRPGTPPDPRITVVASPDVGLGQRSDLLLNPVGGASETFTLPAGSRAQATAPLVFNASPLPLGAYLVRVRVDGAASDLTVDANPNSPTFDEYSGPTVSVT